MRECTNSDYQANIGLVHKVARQCFNRVVAAGISLDYEDVVQEMSETFIKCWRGFNPDMRAESGKPIEFSTYFVTSARNQFNRMVEKPIAERIEHHTHSIEEMNERVGDDARLEDVIASEALTPEQLCLIRQRLEQIAIRVSPLTRVVIEWLINPPEELKRELAARRSFVEHSNAQGVPARVHNKDDISIGGIVRFLRLVDAKAVSKDEVQVMQEELQWIVEKMAA